MGGLLGALVGLGGTLAGQLGGSSAKRDRSDYLNAATNLRNVYNWALPAGQSAFATGQQGVSAGQGNLGTAASYLKSLESGGPASTNAALAPERAQVMSANDAAKRQLAASGTARGGGVAGINQQRDAVAQAAIDQGLFQVRPAAAGELAKVGAEQGQLGLGETALGTETAGLGAETATAAGGLAEDSRRTSQQIHQNAVADITKGFIGLLGNFKLPNFGGGGSNPSVGGTLGNPYFDESGGTD